MSWSPQPTLAVKGCQVIHTRWVLATTLAACEVGCPSHAGDRHQYFSETPDLALVKDVVARAARQAGQSNTVAAVFDVRRAYFHAEEHRDTLVELPDIMGDLRQALYGIRPAAASWGDDLRRGLHAAVSVTIPILLRVQRLVTTSSLPGHARWCSSEWALLKRDGRLVIR